ncbi:MAG: hypothetical protein HC888_04035 [Candidatus Competibacteraceae bacterium]|nr:hypothetical protein [Candidatus Competibacteraceae bacterium]
MFDHVGAHKLAVDHLTQAAHEDGISVVLHPHSVHIFPVKHCDLPRQSLPSADYTISPRKEVVALVEHAAPVGQNLALGCARYNRIWMEALLQILRERFPPSARNLERVRVLVFSRQIAGLTFDDPIIGRISALPFVDLRVKGKPRGCRRDDGESRVPSTALIDWADVVVTAGSSVDLEALWLDKVLIFCEYKARNADMPGRVASLSIPAMRGACAVAVCEEDVLTAISKFHADRSWRPASREIVESVIDELAYDSDPSRDVLGSYATFYRSLLSCGGKLNECDRPN